MPAATGLTKQANIQINPREVDFVTRFQRNWEHLRTILGVMRPIRKTPGTVLKSRSASVTLQSGAVAEGSEIPYSQANVMEKDYVTLSFEKFRKGVTLEAIDKYGYDAAINMTDEEFLFELQSNVTDRLYRYLPTGTLTGRAGTFQSALADAQGMVLDKWRSMHRNATRIVGFANIRDVYSYLGAATIGQQVTNANGINYLTNFMGMNTLILLSGNELKPGKVIATPADNIVIYYADPSDAAFERAGLEYTTGRGATNLIGFHAAGKYETAVSESYAIMAMEMFAEYQDGIAVVTFGDAEPDATSARLSSLSVGSLLLTPAFDPDVTSYTTATTNATNIIRATPEVSGATVAITNGSATVDNGSAATWNDGANTLTATVTNGSATKAYTVTVTKN